MILVDPFQPQIFYNSIILVHLLCSIYCSLMHTGCLLPMCFNLHFLLWAAFCCVCICKELSILGFNVLAWKEVKKTLSWVEFIRSPAGWLCLGLLWLHKAGVPTVGATSCIFHHLYCLCWISRLRSRNNLGLLGFFWFSFLEYQEGTAKALVIKTNSGAALKIIQAFQVSNFQTT